MTDNPEFIEFLRSVKVHPKMKHSRALVDFLLAEAEAGTVTTTQQEAFEMLNRLNAAHLSSEMDCISALTDLDAALTQLQIRVAALGAQVEALTKSKG